MPGKASGPPRPLLCRLASQGPGRARSHTNRFIPATLRSRGVPADSELGLRMGAVSGSGAEAAAGIPPPPIVSGNELENRRSTVPAVSRISSVTDLLGSLANQ